ncbi:DUF3237 domain-containing protein [Microbacterium sp. SSM24]|uniref:DUF3237 domain-containing protein n=1 Tax=Microbacterium sp. SSM24 TaxID=2991714 RepID=UPI002226CB79|nr:DUF3237 domain-containing protein [Microbacterium sp. SSM24]MCW3492695.1 DUF3237 domain-containing protein [Microbacterium sp. SSM24]
MSEPIVPELVRAFDVTVRLGPVEDHGATRAGHRRVIPIVGGEISGAIEATILPGGADWQLVRTDGALEIDGRYSARTADDDLLFLQVSGVRSGPPDVLAALLAGEDVAPTEYYFRTALRIETSAPALASLEHAVFVASCIRHAATVRYTAFRVT